MTRRYKIGTLRDMAQIPEEAMPRFLAELPAILESVRTLTAAAPILAQQMKGDAPPIVRLLPASVFQKGLERAIADRSEWVDDDKGTSTFSMRVTPDSEPFFRVETKLGDGQ